MTFSLSRSLGKKKTAVIFLHDALTIAPATPQTKVWSKTTPPLKLTISETIPSTIYAFRSTILHHLPFVL